MNFFMRFYGWKFSTDFSDEQSQGSLRTRAPVRDSHGAAKGWVVIGTARVEIFLEQADKIVKGSCKEDWVLRLKKKFCVRSERESAAFIGGEDGFFGRAEGGLEK